MAKRGVCLNITPNPKMDFRFGPGRGGFYPSFSPLDPLGIADSLLVGAFGCLLGLVGFAGRRRLARPAAIECGVLFGCPGCVWRELKA